MKLYEITEDIKGLQALADTEELSQESIADTMEALDIQYEEKVEGCLYVRQQLLAEASMIDSEIERLVNLKKAPENNAQRLTDYIKGSMLSLEKDKLDLNLFKVTLRKPIKKLGEIDEDKIADKYWAEVPATRKLDKRALLKDAKISKILGVQVIDSERSLLIK